MSGTAAAVATGARLRLGLRSPRARAAVLVLVALSAVVTGILAATVVLGSAHEDTREATAVLVLLTGWSFVATGLVAWAHRPENSVGRLMVAVGFVSFLGALGGRTRPFPSPSGARS